MNLCWTTFFWHSVGMIYWPHCVVQCCFTDTVLLLSDELLTLWCCWLRTYELSAAFDRAWTLTTWSLNPFRSMLLPRWGEGRTEPMAESTVSFVRDWLSCRVSTLFWKSGSFEILKGLFHSGRNMTKWAEPVWVRKSIQRKQKMNAMCRSVVRESDLCPVPMCPRTDVSSYL